jgi:protein-disulfide isomerase
MANPVIEQLRAEFPNDVRVVSKYFVIHPQAVPSGLAACAANKQGKYTEMKNLLWAKAWTAEGKVINEMLTPEAMETFAGELALDLAKFKADMTGEECRGWLEKSRDSMTPVGTTGTPAFYINGKQTGLDRPEAMKLLVAAAIADADKAIAAGVKQADFYESEIVGKGLKKVKGWFEIEGEE